MIETNRLRILRIDINGQAPVSGQCMRYQLPADASAAARWINEQGLQVTIGNKHECLRDVFGIHRQQQRCPRQETAHLLFDGSTVSRLQEVMGRIHGTAPYLDDAFAIARLRRAQCSHRDYRLCREQYVGARARDPGQYTGWRAEWDSNPRKV